MTARTHWLLLRESLVSLHRSWKSLPEITVVSDGTWTAEEFNKAFNFWPNPIQVLMPHDILEPLARSGENKLVELARTHPLGLKLAVIVLSARERETFFVDSDILWFSDPGEILERFRDVKGPVTTVEDGKSYNDNLVHRFCPAGLARPGINTGCVLLKGNLCEPELFQNLLAAALEDPGHNYNEQTIIAMAVEKGGGKFPAKLCLVDFSGAMSWKRQRPWRQGFHACHYVHWKRYQFYHDARALRRISVS